MYKNLGEIALDTTKNVGERLYCPDCNIGFIVYNGNYFCEFFGDVCNWALPHPVTKRKDRDICDLIGIDYG